MFELIDEKRNKVGESKEKQKETITDEQRND